LNVPQDPKDPECTAYQDHKKNVPLCPLLSMFGSAQHNLTKYLQSSCNLF